MKYGTFCIQIIADRQYWMKTAKKEGNKQDSQLPDICTHKAYLGFSSWKHKPSPRDVVWLMIWELMSCHPKQEPTEPFLLVPTCP